MPSGISTFSLTALAAATVVSAQSINPSSVDIATRMQWCGSQTAQCPILCSQVQQGSQITAQNDCDPDTLNYHCVCDNNITPNASQYSLTIPYYECTTAADQCVANCAAADNACKAQCRTSRPCGAQSPTRVNITTTSSSRTSGPTASTTGGLINGSGTSAASRNLAELDKFYGMAGVLGAVFVGAVALL